MDAADFEVRVDETFSNVCKSLPTCDLHYFMESGKIIKLDLSLTWETFAKMSQKEWCNILVRFSRISSVTDESDIKRSCSWLSRFENGKRSVKNPFYSYDCLGQRDLLMNF